jgi:uncharacterized protein (DUF2126 family)
MSIHIALQHRTSYHYDRLVSLGPQIARLRPAPHSRTRILSYSLTALPQKHFINWQQDPQSNYLARLVFPDKTDRLEVEVNLVAEMAVLNPFDFFLEPEAERAPFSYAATFDHELAPYRLECAPTPRLDEYYENVTGPFAQRKGNDRARTIDFLVAVNQSLHRDVKYLIRLEPGVQTPEETLLNRSGSCRDSAWLMVQLLRRFGFAARFVSGYLVQLVPDVKSLDGPSGAASDFTDLHAWCEAYLPGAGWIGLDPTSGLLAGEGHIPLAATPDPQSAAPISGAVDPCECKLAFEMKVTRIYESPRVTKPYTEEQWKDMDKVGLHVDADLQEHDCHLTMGGEPTFVSVSDRDGAEWNTTAQGPSKRAIADELLRRLKKRFSKGALLHYGQGKWYPGESLPRWAFSAYWRKDGQPLWENEKLFALESTNYGHSNKEAEKFIQALAQRLGCGGKWIMPAYEDSWYYLWKERRLPVNVDPLKSNLKNEEERKRLAKVLEQGLGRVVGYILPVERATAGATPGWKTGPWYFRPEHCFLLPGDSPMGFRLPLESLPWVRAGDYPYIYEQDPLETRSALSRRPAQPYQRQAPLQPVPPAPQVSAPSVPRTALCVESRNGRLHIFMPPARVLEDYLDCVAAVEETAKSLDIPVVVEGYAPPHDHRLNVLKVTPDPGVIEVNLHPSASWNELVEQTETLYEEARQARLSTEKFMMDGRHVGTGGGNHLVLGGPSPAESPLLRRPDLLRSVVSYWQNHPSLSFLFSGLFIGPTSQSPRVDEARNDSLYELGVAFRQLPDGGNVPPWLGDRLFRNLLVDATGNTHRAEFSIDKLFPPESSAGRLGLLEMRAFEMPPHPRMSLAQQLLVRALVSRFWRAPYTESLVPWGTDIHDRWMLPHFVWDDFCDVIEDLRRHGYAMQSEWFRPHFEFRFPQFGDLDVRNIHLEIRQALEPWHVLGEEPGPGGTVRYVDSSLERVQVKARGLTGSRYVIMAAGWALPVHPTGVNGEFVCGLRYRAWQPPNCLHPTIGVHTPLVFDIVDTWNDKSLGGCTYHVMHPGGLNYSTFPINAYEAESRRLGRFFRQGHTGGVVKPRKPARSSEFPFTLDLRVL